MVDAASEGLSSAEAIGRQSTAAVVLCVRNGEATLEQQLRGLARQQTDVPWELLLVDNGSSDETVEVFRRWQAVTGHVASRLIDARRAGGLSAARNTGVAETRADLLLFCDADDVVEAGWINALAAGLATADLVGGRLELDELNSDVVRRWRAGFFSAPVDALPVYGKPYVVGANFALTRRAFDLLDGFDEALRTGCEDIDLSFRAQLHGLALAFEPAAVVQYRFRDDLRALRRQMRNYGRGVAQLHAKYPSAPWLPQLNRGEEMFDAKDLLRRVSELRSDDDLVRARWVQSASYKLGFWTQLLTTRCRSLLVPRPPERD